MIKNTVCRKIKECGIVAVIRAQNEASALKIAEACYQGGIDAIEITFTVSGAAQVIRRLSELYSNSSMIIGAGSVIDVPTAHEAIDAGATFVVGPGFDPDVQHYCKEQKIPYIPGCFTVTEMMQAMKSGVEIIKLFPGSLAGPDYVKAVRGPLPTIQLMPTGGVSLDNLQAWFDSGVIAVGVGGEITAPAKTNDYDAVKKRAEVFVSRIKKIRQG